VEITRLSTKGQVVLPKTIRDTRGWVAGTELVVEETPGGIALRALRHRQPSRLEDVVGCLRYTGRAKTLRQMDDTIAAGVEERRDRGRY
jgi:AbrB family looped-hinge helix DNA binding protein